MEGRRLRRDGRPHPPPDHPRNGPRMATHPPLGHDRLDHHDRSSFRGIKARLARLSNSTCRAPASRGRRSKLAARPRRHARTRRRGCGLFRPRPPHAMHVRWRPLSPPLEQRRHRSTPTCGCRPPIHTVTEPERIRRRFIHLPRWAYLIAGVAGPSMSIAIIGDAPRLPAMLAVIAASVISLALVQCVDAVRAPVALWAAPGRVGEEAARHAREWSAADSIMIIEYTLGVASVRFEGPGGRSSTWEGFVHPESLARLWSLWHSIAPTSPPIFDHRPAPREDMLEGASN